MVLKASTIQQVTHKNFEVYFFAFLIWMTSPMVVVILAW
jgi:hypothetical protein